MLEEDYLKGYQPSAFSSQQSSPNLQPLTSNYNFSDPRLKELNQYSTQLIRETMIPKLTREINSSRRYAPLRQVYYSLILAQHFKKKFINKSGPYSSLMDSRDLTNLTSPEPWDKRTYFKEYQKSFQEGEYNLKASQSTTYGQVIRRYMSGGVELGNGGSSSLIISAKDNRIINHPGILKVSSAILPGDLKALGRPTSSPAVEYVSKSKDLQISDNPKIKRIWGEMVEENLKLYKFAQELTKLTGDYNFINKFPDEDLNNLRVFYNSLNEKDQVYNLGFITFNSGIGKRSGSQLAARFKFNLMFLASMVNAKIEPADIFNKERNNTLLDDKDMEKIASGRKLKEGEELHYLWRHFKAMSDIVWKGVNKNKVDKFFRRFEDLLDIFQQERQSYDEIARVRHAGEKPYMAILKQYQSQIPELINSDSPRQWIERQELVGPITPEGKIGNIGDFPNPRLPGESMGKVRKFRLPDGREVYAKRVNPLRARYPEEEIMISLEVDKSLKKISPYFGVQEFIGIVYDHGAFYLLSLAITGERYSPDKEEANDPYQFKAEVEKILVPLGLGDIEHLFIYKDGNIHCVFLDFETFPYHSAKEENKATEALKSSLSLGSDREVGVRNIVSSATDGDSGELIFKGFEGESKAEILTKVIGSLQKTAKEIEKAGKEMEGVENEQVNIFERYKAFKEEIETNPKLIKEKIEKFGELLDKFSAEVRNIVKNNNNNEEKVFFSEVYVSVFYDLIDKINKARWYPHYIEYGAKVDNFIRVMDAYIKLLSDIQSPEKIEEKYAERMAHRLAESVGEPKLTYRLLKEYNKLPQEEKSSAIPGQIKEAEIEEILKNFPLNNPDWLGGKLKNRIAEDYGRLSVLEPIIADQYGQSNDFLRLPDETMDNLKAQFKEKANEYFYLPIITKHWIKVLTYQYWVNSYNYKVIIAKKSALEKSLNYTYRDIVEGNDDILLLWEFTLRSENNPPTIILEQQGLYKGLRRQGFISEAYPLFVQGLAEKFPGWQVEGEFENPERHENPPALVLLRTIFLIHNH